MILAFFLLNNVIARGIFIGGVQ